MNASSSPVSSEHLDKIAEAACRSALSSATSYVHSDVEAWNTSIINDILQNIVHSASASSVSTTTQYKYAVNSTIVQHLASGTATSGNQTTQSTSGSALGANEADARDNETPVQGTAGDERSNGYTSAAKDTTKPVNGRRGMHSATGAYWNNDTDGMWNFKFEAGEKGMDVVISVIWVAV